jgi:predicted HicB family RNase H-like nuclease
MARKPRSAPEEQRALFVRIPSEQHRALRLLAVNREVRVAELVREALDKYLAAATASGRHVRHHGSG